MATNNLLLFLILSLSASAFPNDKKVARNTIFLDEKLKGQIFEDLQKQNAVSFHEAANSYRLPKTTKPDHYVVSWMVDTDNLVFKGKVTIHLYATQADVKEIFIHSDDLDIKKVELKRNEQEIKQTHYTQEAYDFLIVQLVDGTLEFNEDEPSSILYELNIEFEAELRRDMYGIYQSWFKNDHTETPKYMASTQFQGTSARQAFPCYDEPSFKATFDIRVSRRPGLKSWSNTRLQTTRDSPYGTEFEEDVFFTTPIMSTYLIAIVVAEYESESTKNSDGEILFEVIARPAAMKDNQFEYALKVGQSLLEEMNIYTGINFYDIKNMKMTQAAIPDFGAGAMENWGLLTYREAYLMLSDKHTNKNFKQSIASILMHEIAHMWFGNLVTCEWWDVLWLNEGFARYFQYFSTDMVDRDMGFETRFIVEQIHTALLSDSVSNSHPLTSSGIGSPGAVSGMFSTITYNKGASVIRMTDKLLTYYIHREGLQNYLVKHSFGVAKPMDLFEELEAVALKTGALDMYGEDFSFIDYYKSWTEQPGHPVLNVEVNHKTGQMILTQRRFDINDGYGTSKMNWVIPITYATASNPNFDLTKPSHMITDTVTVLERGYGGDEWIIFNVQQSGFYRVNYDDYTWNLIALALRGTDRTMINEYNKAQIVNDVFQFARAGLMTYSRAFSILSFLENETEYAPWVAAITGFNWLRERLASTTSINELNQLIIDWSQTVMDSLKYEPTEGEAFMTSYKRMQLAPIMCALNVAECRDAATKQFKLLFDEDVEVTPDSRTWVYCNALRDGPPEYFDFLWKRYNEHTVYTEKILLLSALGCTPHEDQLKIFLNAIVEENTLIRPQDYTSAFNSAVSGNEANTQIVFKYIQDNMDKVKKAFSIATALSYVSARLRTEEQVAEFKKWAMNNRESLGSQYDTIVNGANSALESFELAKEIEKEVLIYVSGDVDEITPSSEQPVTDPDPTTVVRPDLEEPTTPQLPYGDSAVVSALSVAVTAVAVVMNIIL